MCPCGPALLAVGVTEGRPRGGTFHRCEGRLRLGTPPPPTARPLGGPLGSATHVLWARLCGCGGPTLSAWPACPVGAACRGGGGGPSPGGVACHRCEGRLVSGAVPPPAARPLGRAARDPRPVCPRCGWCGRWWGAVPGGVACHRCEGRLGSGAPPPPAARPLGGLRGLAGHVLWARPWVCALCVLSARCVSLCVVPLFACPSAAPLSSALVRCDARRVPCACCAPFPALVPCSAAATPCFLRGFVDLFPFLCSPFSLACTFSLRPPCCVSPSFSSPAFSLVAPCETKGRVGVCGPSSCIVGTTFVAALRRITYLSLHLCLCVCARSSPFLPYHGVLMSLFPYPHPFVCCLSWCRSTPYAKRDVRGWGPSLLFLSLLPGGIHTFVGLGW